MSILSVLRLYQWMTPAQPEMYQIDKQPDASCLLPNLPRWALWAQWEFLPEQWQPIVNVRNDGNHTFQGFLVVPLWVPLFCGIYITLVLAF